MAGFLLASRKRFRLDTERLTLRLPDYTAPRIHLPMPPEEAARWRARIEETR